ncbi:MAG: UDP-3-O-acyl-N-acetylglucosamine deacetylase [Syntrophobacterales bacterium]|jgi:UDP-3-O-[3-hydroxymyristoyl] N-acetylglucosamine deacetylase|nr:UDP-3-O-acyl-N-acetylglucosamine deacetylase [Syntrophobacterales bacterium]
MSLQKTVKNDITCNSVGLHSGRKIKMVIRPADADKGIVFSRSDIVEENSVHALVGNVSDTTLATTIGTNGNTVSTVEHLLSALRGLGIDNALIELSGPEIPVMDGSALPFVNMIKETGVVEQELGRRYLKITKEVSVSEGEGWAKLEPGSTFEITYEIYFDHPLIGYQCYHLNLSELTYEKDICFARTFGFLKDVEYLQAKGLALGGSLKNAIVLNEEKIINKEGLRHPLEFVKHKILDAIGDLFLIGMPILGHFSAYKSGHKLHLMLLKELAAHPDCWQVFRYHAPGSFQEEPAVSEQGFTSVI